MKESYPPNLFLFHNYIEEVIKEGKKHIKTAPFDSIDPEGTSPPIQLYSIVIIRNTLISTTPIFWQQWATLKPAKLLVSTMRS